MQLKRGRACLGITVKRLFLFLFCCFVFVVVNVVRKKTWFLFCTIGRTGLVVWQLYKKQVGLCTVIASFCFYRGSFFRRRLLDNSATKLNYQDGQADYKERRLKGSENILIKGWGGGSWFWLRQVSSGTGDGVTNASKSILSLGRSVFFRSPRKRSSAFPWRRTDKVALKRMGWVALEELDKVALKGMDDN